MLGKLLKHEFKITGRMFLPLFAIVAVMTPLLALMSKLFNIDSNSPLAMVSALSMLGYVLLLVAAGVASFVLVIMRFYRSMTKESAYLTFMLPVNTSQLVLSKLIVAFVWQVLSVVIIGLSIAGFTLAHGVWRIEQLQHLWTTIKQLLELPAVDSSQIILLLVLTLLTMIVSAITGTLEIYASVALGQTAKSHRVLASFGCYLALYTVIQMLSGIIVLPFMFMENANQTINASLSMQSGIMGISLGLNVVLGIVFFIMTSKLFKNRLNLE